MKRLLISGFVAVALLAVATTIAFAFNFRLTVLP